jgi:hypothetical protein
MSATSSPPAFADPLAEEGALSPPSRGQRHQGVVTSERAALLAPDVERRIGADAIELVRANGLIAAIETVQSADGSQQGLVIEQDPPAGTPMLREGVLTLRVAQAPAQPEDTDDNDPAAPSHAESSSAAGDEGEDDTEQWFATLAPSALACPAPESVGARPRRRCKHRHAPIPLSPVNSHDDTPAGAPFDTPPDPLPTPSDPLPDGHSNPSPQPAGPGHLTSLIAAVLVRLPDRSVMPAWRRRALVLAAAIVGLVLFTRAGASHSHHQAFASLATAPASRPQVVASPASANPRHRLAAARLPRPRTSRRSAVWTRRPRSTRTPHGSPLATTSAADPIPSASGSSSPPSVPADNRPGPFIYLGK